MSGQVHFQKIVLMVGSLAVLLRRPCQCLSPKHLQSIFPMCKAGMFPLL